MPATRMTYRKLKKAYQRRWHHNIAISYTNKRTGKKAIKLSKKASAMLMEICLKRNVSGIYLITNNYGKG